jgi:NDP-sugar pyrophosphorylase family protein
LRACLAAHKRTGALVTLVAMARKTSRPLIFDSADRLIGRRVAGKGDTIVRAPHGEVVPLGFCGIHVVSPALLPKIAESGAFSLIDCYLRLAAEGEAINAHRVDGSRWRDCGQLEKPPPS